MSFTENIFTPILQLVGALTNSGSIFKRRKRPAFNPKITLGINY